MTVPGAGEATKQLEHSYITSGNAEWYNHFGEQFLKKPNILLPYDPIIPLLAVCPQEIKTHVHTKTCTQMLIAALFIIAKN